MSNPTQVKYPWRAALRTALAYVSAAVVVLPIAYGIFVEHLGQYLPPYVLANFAWSIGVLVAIATLITRIMAIPQVNAWLTNVNAGAAPKGAPESPATEIPEQGESI